MRQARGAGLTNRKRCTLGPMKTHDTTIMKYVDAEHREDVVALWREVFDYPAEYNLPEFVIDRKIEHDELFFVAVRQGRVMGTVMAGYDGHRGWIYSLAVSPTCRKQGMGSMLLESAMLALEQLGCFKVNLQILEENRAVRRFYEANGFAVEKRLSMGRKIG